MRITDEELFSRYNAGDEEAFQELVDRYRKPLFSLVLRMMRDMSEAEDIFQETFFRVIDKADSFDETRKFSSWIFTIAANLARDALRKRSRAGAVTETPEPVSSDNPEENSSAAEIESAITDAMEKLTPEQKEVFLLREYGGMSMKEIAKATDSKLNTVLGRMHLAVQKLREELRDFLEEGT